MRCIHGVMAPTRCKKCNKAIMNRNISIIAYAAAKATGDAFRKCEEAGLEITPHNLRKVGDSSPEAISQYIYEARMVM